MRCFAHRRLFVAEGDEDDEDDGDDDAPAADDDGMYEGLEEVRDAEGLFLPPSRIGVLSVLVCLVVCRRSHHPPLLLLPLLHLAQQQQQRPARR